MVTEKQIEALPDDPSFEWDAWEETHTRIQAAMRATGSDLVCVLVTHPELEILIRDHLEFLEEDLGGVNAEPNEAVLPEIREFVKGRLVSFIRSLAICEHDVQRLSISVAGESIDLGNEGPFCCLDDLDVE